MKKTSMKTSIINPFTCLGAALTRSWACLGVASREAWPALIAVLSLIAAGRVTAQTFTTLHSFTALFPPYSGTNSDGAYPQGGLILSNNTLYGTASEGGCCLLFKTIWLRSSLCALCVLLRQSTLAGVGYVDVNSTNATPPYTNWTIAATNIQDAVDATMAGDEIVVTNGGLRHRRAEWQPRGGGQSVERSERQRPAVHRYLRWCLSLCSVRVLGQRRQPVGLHVDLRIRLLRRGGAL